MGSAFSCPALMPASCGVQAATLRHCHGKKEVQAAHVLAEATKPPNTPETREMRPLPGPASQQCARLIRQMAPRQKRAGVMRASERGSSFSWEEKKVLGTGESPASPPCAVAGLVRTGIVDGPAL